MTTADRSDEAARRRRLIDAAEHEFLRDGYHAATMDRIATRAGMSKKTLYLVFATKEALFRAIIIDRRAPLMAVVPMAGRDPAELLVDVLSRAAAFILAQRQVAICRLVVAGSMRSRRLARAFFESFPECGMSTLEHALTELSGRGIIRFDDPHDAAKMLFGLAIGSLHMGMLIGHEAPPSRKALDHRIRTAVGIFLRGAAA